MKDIVQKAFDYAKKAHQGQTDRANEDYFTAHVLRVFKGVGGEKAPAETAATALLHDVVEDTEHTIEDIRYEFGDQIAAAVDAMTRPEGQDYFEYIDQLQQNEVARQVKISDLTQNSDLSRLPEVGPKDEKRREKYQKALKKLL